MLLRIRDYLLSVEVFADPGGSTPKALTLGSRVRMLLFIFGYKYLRFCVLSGIGGGGGAHVMI
jgi:hypothetical protein